MWAVILAVGAGSYVMRVVPLLFVGRVDLPPSIERGVARAGSAALAAVTVSAVAHAWSSGDAVPTAVALGCGGLAAVHRWSLLRVVVLGVAVYASLAAMV